VARPFKITSDEVAHSMPAKLNGLVKGWINSRLAGAAGRHDVLEASPGSTTKSEFEADAPAPQRSPLPWVKRGKKAHALDVESNA
jgi:hypothetical protein